MNSLLLKTLKCIEKEKQENKFNEAFDLVNSLVKEYGEEDLANRLYYEIDESVAWETVADLYSFLIWSTSDNGHALVKTMGQWLTDCIDERKIRIVLNIEVYPFSDLKELQEKLRKVSLQFPAVSKYCERLIKLRVEQNL